jgi:hypothetical protein
MCLILEQKPLIMQIPGCSLSGEDGESGGT